MVGVGETGKKEGEKNNNNSSNIKNKTDKRRYESKSGRKNNTLELVAFNGDVWFQ